MCDFYLFGREHKREPTAVDLASIGELMEAAKKLMSETKMFIFKINPIGKPRMTQRDKWKHRPIVDQYFAFKDLLNQEARNHRYEIGSEFRIEFFSN